MQVQVLVFGQLTDVTGSASFTVDDAMDTDALQQMLVGRYPALAQKNYLVAVNKRPVQANTQLTDGATVALLPPFSGG